MLPLTRASDFKSIIVVAVVVNPKAEKALKMETNDRNNLAKIRLSKVSIFPYLLFAVVGQGHIIVFWLLLQQKSAALSHTSSQTRIN